MSEFKRKPSFYADLRAGQESERKFLEKYGQYLDALDGKQGDFIIKGTNLKIEFKCDSYDHDRWANFVMEHFRSGNKVGGPAQALEHGCRYFVYYFSKNDLMYMFDTYQLCRRIKALVKKHKIALETISNGTYTTSYHRVPRDYFKDIMLDFHAVVKRKFTLAAARRAKKVLK